MNEKLERFLERSREIHDLTEIQQGLEWDQQVMMPRKGAAQRGAQQAALAGLIHARLTSPELGDLIRTLAEEDGLDETRKADVREAMRAWERSTKIPVRLVTERAQACALSQVAWEEARHNDDFEAFRPHLEKVIALTREMAAALEAPNAYDALLEDFEPGMTEEALRTLFGELKPELVTLLDKIKGAPNPPSQEPVLRHYPRSGQEAFSRRVMADMGYDLGAGRLDASAHPFTSGTFADVRITTRYDENFLNMALFGTIHETGHALYEQGLDPDRYRDPSGQACSLGIHESQSRFWENLIGRSRPFWKHYYAELRKAFPGVLDDVDLDAFYRAINVCQPSLIRVEADEVTYNLHIILRFELESALLAGKLEAGDLPEAWNSKMQELLGILPSTFREGVLQDIHWSAGLIGYFPTYALGNLYGAQFLEKLREDLPDLNERVSRGELGPIKEWLNTRIHVHGRRYLAPELCRKVTGKPLSIRPSVAYLTRKFGEIYGF